VKHALAVLTGIAVGMPAMAALASVSGHTAGGLPDRYVPWARTRQHVDSRFATLRAPARRRVRPAARRTAQRSRTRGTVSRALPGGTPGSAAGPRSRSAPVLPTILGQAPTGPLSREAVSPGPPAPLSRTVRPHVARAEPRGRPEPTADLRVTIVAPPSVRPGGLYTYRVRLANRGPGTPSAVTVRNVLPKGVVRTGSTLPDGVGGYAGGRDATLVMPRLAPGRSATARFDVRVRPGVRGELVAHSRIAHVEGVRMRHPHDGASTAATRVE
jgi:uncharacterized repeat protein (TIGR01451 family)